MEKITVNARELSIRLVPLRDADELRIRQIIDGTGQTFSIVSGTKLLAINLWD